MREYRKEHKKEIEELQRLEKRYSSLMKQSFEAAVRDREYSNELNTIALGLKVEIDELRSEMYAD